MIDPNAESAKNGILLKCVRPSEHQNKILDPPPAPSGHKKQKGKFTMLIINYNMKGDTRKDIHKGVQQSCFPQQVSGVNHYQTFYAPVTGCNRRKKVRHNTTHNVCTLLRIAIEGVTRAVV